MFHHGSFRGVVERSTFPCEAVERSTVRCEAIECPTILPWSASQSLSRRHARMSLRRSVVSPGRCNAGIAAIASARR